LFVVHETIILYDKFYSITHIPAR